MKKIRVHFTLARDIRRRRWMLLHALLLATLTCSLAWAISHVLLLRGVEAMWLRYAVAITLGYAVYLLLVRLWAAYLASKEKASDHMQGDWPSGGGSRNSTGSKAQTEEVEFVSYGGGDFAGAGAGGSFEEAGAELASQAVSEATSLIPDVDIDEAAVVLIPVVLVIALFAAVAAMLGVGIAALFGIDLLLGAAVEVALASYAASVAVKARHEGWLKFMLRRTFVPFLVLLIAGVLSALAVQYVVPQANSMPKAIKHIIEK
jgi:Ca2+/Na+ antiporter